ncbi:hypothetical protein DBR46_24645 [Pseudomonas sp. KBW05]|nr:hypothetical protein DBR46_24645 [Pseudomonas sp. KBW05]
MRYQGNAGDKAGDGTELSGVGLVWKTEWPPSRASPLPHLTAFQSWNSVKCGSGLAREGSDSVSSEHHTISLRIHSTTDVRCGTQPNTSRARWPRTRLLDPKP